MSGRQLAIWKKQTLRDCLLDGKSQFLDYRISRSELMAQQAVCDERSCRKLQASSVISTLGGMLYYYLYWTEQTADRHAFRFRQNLTRC